MNQVRYGETHFESQMLIPTKQREGKREEGEQKDPHYYRTNGRLGDKTTK